MGSRNSDPAALCRDGYVYALCLFAALLAGSPKASAQQTPAAPSLVNMVTTLSSQGVYQFDALEYDAAAANDAAYKNLLTVCAPASGIPAASCTGTTQILFNRLRDLEDNADQLLGSGETQYSLRLTPEGMAKALRWTAPTEYAAQGSITTRFANSQATLLNSRLTALRVSTGSLAAAGGAFDDDETLASADSGALGGGAGDDLTGFPLGRLSIYGSGSFGTGSQAPTTFEDAFSFDTTEASIGADYRLSGQWVIGTLFTHTERRVDFNSELSVVDGGIRGNGQGGLLYAQFSGNSFYVNGSAGIEHLSLSSVRRITYPSNNPAIPSVDDTAYSNTGANTLTATLQAGYYFHYRAFSATPYLSGQYIRAQVSAFTEYSAEGFDFAVGEQTIHSAEIAPGLMLDYAIPTRFGIIKPYVSGEYRRELSDASRIVDSNYAALAGDSNTPGMNLPTDAAPNHYFVVSGGANVVLPHGLQGFVQYTQILQYTNLTDHIVSGGFRLEL
jgi:uncharacterized protein YhjY with autotransporter beta-barrel domain